MHLHGLADHLREKAHERPAPAVIRLLLSAMDDGKLLLCDAYGCGEVCSPHDAVTCEDHAACSRHEAATDCVSCERAAEAARQERLAELEADEWRHRAMGRL